jgi:hypothetical protein
MSEEASRVPTDLLVAFIGHRMACLHATEMLLACCWHDYGVDDMPED